MSTAAPAPVRSPSYPNMSLGDAIAAVAKIEKPYRLSPVDREVAAKLIGYSGISGPSSKSLAALASYGLVERAGKGEMRVTGRASAILHPNDPQERRESLVAAAFEPNLFRELRDRWPGMIPPEEGIVTYLHRKGFNQTAIRPAMKAYRDTLVYLEQEGASDSHGTESSDAPESPSLKDGEQVAVRDKAQIGDLVDVEINGSLVTEKPVRVRAVSDDGAWVFVDGSQTGIKMDDVILRERGTGETPPTLAFSDPEKLPVPSGYRSETFDADEGEIRITWPSNLSLQSVEDMKDWLELLKRRIARRAGEGSGQDG